MLSEWTRRLQQCLPVAKGPGVLYAVLIALGLGSCGKFCQCDPDVGGRLDVKLLNQQGQSIVSGPQRLYDADSIKFLKDRNDTSSRSGVLYQSNFDSSELDLVFNLPANKGYLYYNTQTAVDSVEVEWVQKQGKCCGEPFTYTEAHQVKFNNRIIEPQNSFYFL